MARIKVFDKKTHTWVYADKSFGKDGVTPVKGVDYYTEEDKAEFSAYIATEMAKRGQLKPEFANSIEECTDATKLYVLPDGFVYAYMYTSITVETGKNILPTLEPISGLTKTDTGLYYGKYASDQAVSTDANCTVTGVIPVTKADCPFTFYIKGVSSWGGSSHDRIGIVLGNELRAAFALNNSTASTFFDVVELESGYYQVTVNAEYFDYVTWATCDGVVLSLDNTTDGQAIEVSLEPYDTTTKEDYAWVNTGHAFVTSENIDGEININVHSNVEFVDSIDECVDRNKIYVIDGFIYAYMHTSTTVETGDNILPTLVPISGLTTNKTGLYYGYYVTTTSPYYSTDTNCTITGMIPHTIDNHPVLYIKGVKWDSSASHSRVMFMKNGGAHVQTTVNLSAISKYFTITELDTNYYKMEYVSGYDIDASAGTISHIVLSFDNTLGTEDIQVSLEPFSTTTKEGYAWVDTGHAFVPADYGNKIVDLEDRTTSLENRVDELSVGDNGTFTYIAEEAKRVAKIVQANRTVGSLTFSAMSDMHVEVDTELTFGVKNNLTSCRDAGMGLCELQKHFKLDFSAMLGDYTYGDTRETIAQVKKDLTFVKNSMTNGTKGIPSIWCTGNHDINYGANTDRRMTEDELYAYITSNNTGMVQDSDNIGRNYGYIDFENQRIRCIYLNTVDALDYPDNTDGTADDASEVTAIQTQWLVDTALNLSDKEDATKWGFVILSHHCIRTFQHITAVLTAYHNGTNGSVNVTTNGVTTTVNYNFTSANRGEIICAVHGHNHNFNYKKISDEKWNAVTEANAWLWSIGVPNIDTTRNNEVATSADTEYAAAFGEFDTNGNPVYYLKTQGTAKSTSFCVITIDRKNRKIHAVAYGAGIDRTVSY